VVGWADPFAILSQAGRQPARIQLGDRRYRQLLFTPYRVVYVAPKKSDA